MLATRGTALPSSASPASCHAGVQHPHPARHRAARTAVDLHICCVVQVLPGFCSRHGAAIGSRHERARSRAVARLARIGGRRRSRSSGGRVRPTALVPAALSRREGLVTGLHEGTQGSTQARWANIRGTGGWLREGLAFIVQSASAAVVPHGGQRTISSTSLLLHAT